MGLIDFFTVFLSHFGRSLKHCTPAFCYHHSDNRRWCLYLIVCPQVKVGELFGDFFSILSRHRVRLDSSFVNVMIAVVMVEGLGRGLNPDMDILHTLRKYLIKVWTGSYGRRVCSEVVSEHCAILLWNHSRSYRIWCNLLNLVIYALFNNAAISSTSELAFGSVYENFGIIFWSAYKVIKQTGGWMENLMRKFKKYSVLIIEGGPLCGWSEYATWKFNTA